MYKNITYYKNLQKYQKIIILIRHSEAKHNKNVNIAVKNAIKNNECPKKAKENELMKKQYINPSLSQKGIQNAKKNISFIQKYINIHDTIVISSPLLRTLQTAYIFDFKNERNNIITHDLLIERRTKRPCDNFTLQSIDQKNPEETNEQVFERTKQICKFINTINNKKYIVIITHKRFLIELSKNIKIFENYGDPYFEPGEFRFFVK